MQKTTRNLNISFFRQKNLLNKNQKIFVPISFKNDSLKDVTNWRASEALIWEPVQKSEFFFGGGARPRSAGSGAEVNEDATRMNERMRRSLMLGAVNSKVSLRTRRGSLASLFSNDSAGETYKYV